VSALKGSNNAPNNAPTFVTDDLALNSNLGRCASQACSGSASASCPSARLPIQEARSLGCFLSCRLTVTNQQCGATGGDYGTAKCARLQVGTAAACAMLQR
jgi:hypothetical protein